MKAAVLLALLLAIPAEARTPRRVPSATVGAVPDPNRGDFWRDILEPHSEQVRHLLAVARQMRGQADTAQSGDYDPTGEQRAAYYAQIFRIMRYAHRLAPENVEVMSYLGEAADELGKTRQALDVLEAAVRLVGPERSGPDITGRLGGIYLRLGRVDDAIRYLRIAQGPITGDPMSAQVVVWLASALGARGEMDDAIDVLATALPPNVPFYSNPAALVGFALAVQYDRDDQRGAAFEMLDRLESQLQAQQFAAQVQSSLTFMRWAPAEDQHYYQALLYETMGHYTEARAEWALYAAAGDLPFRARALEHIAAIDKQRATNTVSVPPAFVPRRYRHHPAPPPSPTP